MPVVIRLSMILNGELFRAEKICKEVREAAFIIGPKNPSVRQTLLDNGVARLSKNLAVTIEAAVVDSGAAIAQSKRDKPIEEISSKPTTAGEQQKRKKELDLAKKNAIADYVSGSLTPERAASNLGLVQPGHKTKKFTLRSREYINEDGDLVSMEGNTPVVQELTGEKKVAFEKWKQQMRSGKGVERTEL